MNVGWLHLWFVIGNVQLYTRICCSMKDKETFILKFENWDYWRKQIWFSVFAVSKKKKKNTTCLGLQKELVVIENQKMSNKLRDRAVKRIWLGAQQAVWPSALSFLFSTILRWSFILFIPIFALFHFFFGFWPHTGWCKLPVGELMRPGMFSSPDTRTFSGSRCMAESRAGCFLITHSRCAPSTVVRRLVSVMTWKNNKSSGRFLIFHSKLQLWMIPWSNLKSPADPHKQ